jgi:hypothetical protein
LFIFFYSFFWPCADKMTAEENTQRKTPPHSGTGRAERTAEKQAAAADRQTEPQSEEGTWQPEKADASFHPPSFSRSADGTDGRKQKRLAAVSPVITASGVQNR